MFRLNDDLDFNYIEKFFGQLDGWYYTAGLAALGNWLRFILKNSDERKTQKQL